MKIILFLALVPECLSFCEAAWSSNISAAYGSSENLTETANAISSLSYSIFGLIGIVLKHHSPLYYLVMQSFILLGLGSFLHHYYYTQADWAYAADISTMYLVSSFSLFYILADNEYEKFRRCLNFFGFLNTIGYTTQIIFYKVGDVTRNTILQVQMGAIIFTQCCICLYFLYINSPIKYKILFSSLWNGALFSLGGAMWHLDNSCPDWVVASRFNGHVIWHIVVAWSLFNAINITNVCRYTYNEVKYTWIPLFPRLPGFLYVIDVGTEKTNLRNTYTNINLEEVKLFGSSGYHRRINTYG